MTIVDDKVLSAAEEANANFVRCSDLITQPESKCVVGNGYSVGGGAEEPLVHLDGVINSDRVVHTIEPLLNKLLALDKEDKGYIRNQKMGIINVITHMLVEAYNHDRQGK